VRYRLQMYPALLCFAFALILTGLVWDGPQAVLAGLHHIIIMPDMLITDYVDIAGPGAALVNSGLVTLFSIALLYISKNPPSGFTIVEIGLMSGFSFFGKNIVNILPIVAGTWLYARYRKEPFSSYSSVALLSTSLAPMVSYMAIDGGYVGILSGIGIGLLIGFVLPPLGVYTYKIQNGMNLYNMGFACGLLGLMLVPLMISSGKIITTAAYWATGYSLPLGIMVAVLSIILISVGFFFSGKPAWAVWAGYRRLLHTSGRAPSDYLRMFGGGTVLVNMGINGLVAIGYILAIGGNLNGPTLGGILTIIGFSAFGKHIFNITPIMLGVLLGGVVMQWSINDPALQIAGLFCTTLAPVAGYFGWQYGIVAGFIHSSLVLRTGSALSGMNLYNNGFSGGLLAIVLYPIILAIARHRKPVLQDEELMDIFEGNNPITMTTDHLPEDKLPEEIPNEPSTI